MTDDEFHTLEAEMAAQQRQVWKVAADLAAELRAHVRARADLDGAPYFEFESADLIDAKDAAEAFAEFPAVDRDERYDGP